MSKFKYGDTVRVVSVVPVDGNNGVNVGDIGIIKDRYGDHGSFVDFGRNIKTGTWASHKGAYVMWDDQLELAPPEIPASPFYVAAGFGYSYKVEVDGRHYSMTCIETGRCYPLHAETDRIPGFFKDGMWKLIDPPAPAVDPVATATAEVQRLLREQADAKAECDRIDAEQAKAEEKRRNIGKALSEARIALEKANHEAAGVKFEEQPAYVLTTSAGNTFTLR